MYVLNGVLTLLLLLLLLTFSLEGSKIPSLVRAALGVDRWLPTYERSPNEAAGRQALRQAVRLCMYVCRHVCMYMY